MSSSPVNTPAYGCCILSPITPVVPSVLTDKDLCGRNVLLLTSLLQEVLKVPREKVCYCSMSLCHIIVMQPHQNVRQVFNGSHILYGKSFCSLVTYIVLLKLSLTLAKTLTLTLQPTHRPQPLYILLRKLQPYEVGDNTLQRINVATTTMYH